MGVSRTGLCASLTLLGVAFALAPVAGIRARPGGSIAGTISTKEAAAKPLRITIDPAVCGATLADESVTVDASGRLANVVIAVTGLKATTLAEATVVNDGCKFVPRVSLLRPGGSVKMTSKDAVLHTMHAAAADARALFNVSLPIPNMTISRPVDKPGAVTLSCSTHTWMRGYLFVGDQPAAISGADGAFRIDNVPAGTHEVRVWHETLGAAPVKVTVKDGETATIAVTMAKSVK